MTENAAFRIIEDKVQEIEQERKLLSSECDILRSENKWFRKKVAELEKSLMLTENKHYSLKKHQEEQEKLINSMQQSLVEVTTKKPKEKKKKSSSKVTHQHTNIYEKSKADGNDRVVIPAPPATTTTSGEKFIIAERIVDPPTDYIKPEKYAQVLADYENVLDKLRFLESDNELLRKQAKDFQDQLKSQRQITDFDKEHLLREFDQQRHDLDKIIKDLRQDSRFQEKKILEQQTEIRVKDKKNQDLQQDIRLQEKRILEQQADIISQEKKIQDLQNEYRLQEKKILEQQNELRSQEKRLLDQQTDWRLHEKKLLNQQYQAISHQIRKEPEIDPYFGESMKYELVRYKETVKMLQLKTQKYKKRIRQLEDMYKESTQQNEELRQQKQIDMALADVETEKRRISFNDARTQTSQPVQAVVSLACSTQTQSSYQRDVFTQTSKKEENSLILEKEFKQQMDQVEQLQRDQLKYEKEIEEYKRQLHDVRDQNKQLGMSLDESKTHITNLNSEIQTNVNQLETAWKDNNIMKQQISKLTNKIQRLEQKKRLLRRELEYKDTEVIKRNRFISNLVQPTLQHALQNGNLPLHQNT